ncbi:MAG: GEVED domain-containing protein [Pirellulales bacterium]
MWYSRFPVVLTSLRDDGVGAGNDLTGKPLLDTNNDASNSAPQAGDWRSVLMKPYANDRNVVMITELESDALQDIGTNDTVDTAEVVGSLANNLNGGDENLRLGFSIDGSIASKQDLDVYSFSATAGTPVWLDIDRTSGIDSVVEILDSSGNIVALKVMIHFRKGLGNSSRYVISDATKVLPSQALGLDSDPSAPRNSLAGIAEDLYTVNPLDAGMQIILPGASGAADTYYIRVRSSNLAPGDAASNLQDASKVRQGITTGTYRLQVRMRQADEVPGSTVEFSDIRYAVDGIRVEGLPSSSPLLGQIDESGNTNLGNIGNTDRGSLTIGGTIATQAQSDSYDFTVQRSDVVSGDHVSVVFDVDYADGHGRPDTTLWVFRADGTLVFTGTNSSVSDDQSAPGKGSNLADLTRGSNGKRDAFIGPVELQPGSYTVKITNNSQTSIKLNSSLVRREPLDSIRRISIDRFDSPLLETTNSPAQVSFDTDPANNRVEWNLSDLTTYVVSDNGAANSTLSFANAMTGDKVADVSIFPRVNDIATSPDGRVVGYQIVPGAGNTTDANGGNLLLINSTGNKGSTAIPTGLGAGANVVGSSGIITWTVQQTAATTFAAQQRDHTGFGDGNTPQGDAIVFHALGFHTSGNTLGMFGVGSRGNGQTTFNLGALDANNNVILGANSTYTTNIVYRLDPTTGAAINPPNTPDRTATVPLSGLNAAGTNKVEFGRFITTGVIQGLAEIGGTLFAVSNQGQFFRVGVGTDVTTAGRFGDVNPFSTITDPGTGTAIVFNGLTRGPRNMANPLGGTMANLLFGSTADGTIYAFNTAGVLQPVFPGFSYKTQVAGALGTTVSGIDFSALDVNLWHLTNLRNTDQGHGRNPTPTGSQTGTAQGGNSLYFGFRNPNNAGGFQQQGNWGGVYNTVATDRTYNTPGGAHGAIVSNPIDLSNYSPDDQPMMYFNYYLDSENSNADFQQNALMRDAFRVYGAGDDGQWVLLATNNSASDNGQDRGDPTGGAARNGRFDELDNVVSGNYDAYGAPVLGQNLIDSASQGNYTWQQARVPLAALAGKPNVRLRFEFSTAATFETGDPLRGGVELVSVAGNKISDGTGFTFTPNSITGFGVRNFEFDHGLVLAMPGGASLVSGVSTLTVNGTLFTFSTATNVGNNIQYSLADTPATIAQLVSNKLAAVLAVPAADLNFDPDKPNILSVANLPAAGVYAAGGGLLTGDIIKGTPGVTAGSVSIPVNLAMTATQVRNAMRLTFAQTYSDANMIANFGVNAAAQAWPVTGNTVLVYKFDVTNNTSAIGLTTNRIGDFFGVDKNSTASENDDRANDNAHEGLFIDDIIIGFAERGEMVLNDLDTSGLQGNFNSNTEYYQNLYGIAQVETGNYQLTVRTAADYGTSAGNSLALNSFPPLGRDFDTNDRLSKSYNMIVQAAAVGSITDGTTFTLSDRKDVVTFEYDVTSGATDVASGVTPGNVAVKISNTASAHDIAVAIRDAINSITVQQLIGITANILGETNGASAGTSIELHGPAATDLNGNFTFAANTFITAQTNGTETSFGEDLADVERLRPQGQIVLSNNTVTNSSNYGITATFGNQNQQNGSGNRPYPGAPIKFPTVNTSSLAPGVVIANNILANNAVGGVLSADDPSAGTANPVARIVNNTFFGGAVGVQLANGSSPTIINNIFASTSGLAVDPGTGPTTNVVLGANLYRNSAASPLMAESFGITTTNPLFVNTTNRKFYLASGAAAIDASLNVLQERNALTLVKSPLGLPLSQTLAPEEDLNGQTRLDDPSVNSPTGMGSNVFKDRGAVERADFTGPLAVILQPQDNDSQNVDADRNITYIRTQQADLNSFSFLLQDPLGTGPDPATVIPAGIVLTENGRVLRESSDYVMGYNANSRTLRLTPLAGIWRNDSVYEITLNNTDGHRVSLPSGSSLRDGDKVVVLVGATTTTLEFDNNGAATGTAIPFTATSSAYELATQIAYKLNLAGIVTRLEGDGDLFITGATSVTATTASAPGLIAVTSVSAIRDLAGNALVPNRSTNLTQFTIVMPDALLDYGDSNGARIPTVETATALNGNGARNVILPIDYTVLALGTWADANSNGLPSAAADGDDSDVQISFGTLGGVTQGTAGSARLQMPAAAGLNGQGVAITDKVNPIFFQFTFNASDVSDATTRYVLLNPLDSATTVATKFATAVYDAMKLAILGGLTPIASGNIVSLGGSSLIKFDVSAAPSVTRLKQGQVDMVIPASIATLADGQTMSITDSRGRTLTFELNDTSVASTVATGNIAVNVNFATATSATVAAAFASAINGQISAGNISLGGASVVNTTTVRIFGDDEDGVTFDGLFNAGSPPVATFVTATDYGMLDVWVDWNSDGDFADASEKVFTTSIPVHPGLNRVDIATPAGAVSGFTTARFRLSTLGGLLATGVGVGGETEDYMIEIAPGRPPLSSPDNYSIAEDNILNKNASQGVLSNDTDADVVTVIPGTNIFVNDEVPTTLAVEPMVNVTKGTLVLNNDGSFTYTPFPEYNGPDFFVYRATDGRLLGQPVTVSLTVTPVNDVPFANDDTMTVFEDSTVNVLGTTFTSNDFAHYLLQTSSNGFQTNELSQVLTLVNASIISDATTSFGIVGTNVQFAARPGQGAYGLKVTFFRSDLGNAVAPAVTVVGTDIRVTLNSNATTPSTIADMIGAIAGNLQAHNLVTVSLLAGSAGSVIGLIPSIPQVVIPPS